MINLVNHNKKIKCNLQNIYFFIDNAKIHNSRVTKNFFDNLNIIYNIPYSCDMNPIENVFGIVKAKFRNLNIMSNQEILSKILSSFGSISSINIEWCHGHLFKIYEKAYNLEDI